MSYNCGLPMNNLTYCTLNPIEKVGHFLTKSNYGLPPNWVFLALGIGMILLYGFIWMKILDKRDVNVAKPEVEKER